MNYYDPEDKPLVQTFKEPGCDDPANSFFTSHLNLDATAGLDNYGISSVYVQPGTYVIFTDSAITESAIEQELTNGGPQRTWLNEGKSYPLVKKSVINAMNTRRYDGMSSSAIGKQFVCRDLPSYYYDPKGMLLCKLDCD